MIFFQHDKRKFPVIKLINILFPRQNQLIMTPFSSLVKVSFYLVSAIGKFKVGKSYQILASWLSSESVFQRSFVKKVLLEISQNSQENTCARVCFLNKVAGLRLATLLKKRLWLRWILQNFLEHLFYRTPPDDCFLTALKRIPNHTVNSSLLSQPSPK